MTELTQEELTTEINAICEKIADKAFPRRIPLWDECVLLGLKTLITGAEPSKENLLLAADFSIAMADLIIKARSDRATGKVNPGEDQQKGDNTDGM